MSGHSEHDCRTHDGAIRQAATTAAERADVKATTAPWLMSVIQIGQVARHDVRAFFEPLR